MVEAPSENCPLVRTYSLPTKPSFFFSSFLSHLSLSIFLFHSCYLVPSDSQCRCRRSSFGSTRLLANVPISEGRVRTTNHRRRGRGERLGRAVRFCALGCFHSLAAPIDGERVFPLKTISLSFCKYTKNSRIFKTYSR